MTSAAPTGAWRTATVRSVERPSPHAVILRMEVPDRIDHVPGQHYVIRLTAEDGYVAQRSYSVASPPSDELIEFYIERLPDGEVSAFLADIVEPGDELQVRGPIGGWFVWRADSPACGLAGGSGVVPLIAMLRHAQRLDRTELLTLVVAARSLDRLPYAGELLEADATIALSRKDHGSRHAARLNSADVEELAAQAGLCLVCGSHGYVESATGLLLDAGVTADRIRVERFGPSS